MATPATAIELEEMLGEVDELVIERILETRATADEVAEALADLEDERRFGERRETTSAKVVAVREILEEVLEEDEDLEAVLGHPA